MVLFFVNFLTDCLLVNLTSKELENSSDVK